ncbi:MAG TPA: TIGR03087 family PEP-CTERM/XrtA system glycosyltransferase [Stellaceae bacterium]|jgi:sugar transferase (PEP-CTERM/EpsH1 system associated)|nr:TIGR03087 family PEP-CTERM/XrtA system glycosyltransferase [Stellaceae bacterium]
MADLLFLAHRMPYPLDGGDKVRSWHILRHLAERHRVHLGCFHDGADKRHIAELEKICASVMCLPLHPLLRRCKSLGALKSGESMSIAYFRDERLMRWIAETFARWRPSEAFVFGSSMSTYLDGYRFGTRVIDMVDVESEKWHQFADKRPWPMKAIYRREARKLRQVEIAAARSFDYTLFASAAEASLFLKRTGRSAARVLAMRNGVDFDFFDPAQAGANPYPQGRKSIAFIGAMNHGPNVEAAKWFIAEVMTALRHRFPAFDFWIVGAHPAASLRRLARGDVHLAGRVPDIRPYIAHADAVVAPLRSAGGSENKLLEALAMAKPVVATPAALDGLDLNIGGEVLAASNAQQFANTIARLFNGEMAELGARARQRIVADYGWAASLRVLEGLFAEPRPELLAAAS